MTTPEREQAASVWPTLMAIGAVVICCAGPVLIAVLAATGLAAAVVRSAAPVAIGLGFITLLAIAGFAWRRRRVCACSDAPVPSQRGPVRSADERTADPRSHLTHVP